VFMGKHEICNYNMNHANLGYNLSQLIKQIENKLKVLFAASIMKFSEDIFQSMTKIGKYYWQARPINNYIFW